MENTKEFLPIGTVITIYGLEQKVMIYGRKQQQSKEKKIWDYVGCLYPYGNLSKDYNVFFDHIQIEEILFTGYENEEELSLRKELI